MKKITVITFLSLIFLSACSLPVQKPIDTVTNFEECVAAGNPVMESYPRQCRDGDKLFVEEIEGVPKPCTWEYKPVCGEIEVQCFKAPCPPLKTTYQNHCMAENAGSEKITEGPCMEEGPDMQGMCEEAKGKWLGESQECEGIGRDNCEKLGGTYNECASACRNDPDAEICTMQCVLVCDFSND